MSRKNIITLILALVALTAGAQRRVGERSSGMEKETLQGKCKQNAK